MSQVAVIGARTAVQGYGLAGALVRVAEDPEAVRRRWSELPAGIAVVVLTAAAETALRGQLDADDGPLIAVMT
ncbi:V-type ATP synthase subunit F [Paractinoplanes hotanensis]|uniref:V-type ATP synthase subunit F n=1 Tax=Paractinoplanes hotanensis TaxID=2906497 RepID=A0ABT0YFS5_9ACTN|nr:V-type ATP synthase subunit F [Actinoplanes hotanensis]MCM4084363.1 V-type ATP synthase subunit F [Actinoplanes hotanensis]